MKKILFILSVAIALLNSKSTVAQTSANYKSQRDSIYALYIFVLEKFDSVIVANNALNKKMEQNSLELKSLKNEIADILKMKEESTAELTMAKELIQEQATLLEKLEAEVKRLSQSKKSKQ